MLSRREGVAEAKGVDGVTRLYGFSRAGRRGDDTDGVHVAVGVSSAALADASYKQLALNIILVLSVTAGVFTFGVSAFRKTTDTLELGMETFRDLSLRDPLTNLYNRRFLEDFLERELLRAKRSTGTFALIMIDIDHFKKFNDTFGHDCGDRVLIALADLFRQNVRDEDIASRFGGEEFILVLPGVNVEIAKLRAENIRDAAQHIAIDCNGVRIGPITLSLGVSMYPAHGDSMKALLQGADAALYGAKDGGRNRVIIAGQTPIA
jgi:diguanylate cyclase (GGDEF)-like protein